MKHRNTIKQKNTFCVYCVHGGVFITKYETRINYKKNRNISRIFLRKSCVSIFSHTLPLRGKPWSKTILWLCAPPPHTLISLFWRVAALLFSDVHQRGYLETLGLFASYHPETHVIADILFSSQKMLLKKNCGGKTRTIKIRVSEIRFSLCFSTLDRQSLLLQFIVRKVCEEGTFDRAF